MKISTRIIIGVIGVCAAISAGFLVSGTLIIDLTEREFLALTALNEEAAARSLLRNRTAPFKGHARTIARERAAIQALAEGRIEDLRGEMVSTFNRIERTGQISDLAIFGIDGTHKVAFPADWNGTQSRLVTEVIETGKRAAGMTRLPNGRVGLGYAMPLLEGREKVGVALIALDVATTVPAIGEAIDGDAVLVTGGGELARSEDAPPGVPALRDLDESGEQFAIMSRDGQTLVVVRSRLLEDAEGASDIVLFSDITAQREEIETRTMAFLGAVLLGTIGSVAGFLFWLRREFGPLATMTQALSALSRGEPIETVAVVSKAEEIGALGEALDMFIDQSNQQRELLEAQRIAGAEAKARAEKAAALQSNVGVVMSQAAMGDFSSRMEVDADDPSSVEIGTHVNRMLDATQQAFDRIDRVLGALADADLTQDMDGQFVGRFAEIQVSMNATVRRLRDLIGETQAASRTVNSVAEKIEVEAAALSSQMESQSATLEKTAATTEEIATGVRSNEAELASAEALANQVRTTTTDVSKSVEGAISAVRRIKTEANEITQIINVIDSIAFQTNLLALNAAVEAARAGEHGKGFAVVASEVRTLAQRTAEAAKDIAHKIGDSGASVDVGVSLVESMGGALREIETRIVELAELINACADTSHHQTTGVEEMNVAITQLDGIAQETSTVSDRNLAAAQILASEISQLDTLIGSFRMHPTPVTLRDAS